jgi:hypothetical protein
MFLRYFPDSAPTKTLGCGRRSVHGDMHGSETKHGTNLNGDEKTLPEFEERDASGVVAAGDVSEELIQEGRGGGI